MRNLENHEMREEHWQDIFDSKRTLGERMADSVAQNAGSWYFVFAVLAGIAVWAVYFYKHSLKISRANLVMQNLGARPWDEYPFILLNLFLSILAAMQGF